MSNHWYPKDTKAPLKINPDGTQSPNPNYTGNNGYKRLPNGKLVPKNPRVPAPVKAGGGFLGTLGTWVNGLTAINAGYTAGMEVDSRRTGREQGFSSARGEGRRGAVEAGGGGHIPVTTYADGRSVSRASNLPPSANDTSQYPEGVSTGYRSRREGLDATYPERIPQDGGGDEDAGDGYTGRDASAPNGSDAKGTNTGYKIDLGIAEKYAGAKIADVNNFLSTQLPAGPNQKSSSSGLSNEDFIMQAQAGGYLDTFRGKTNDEAILHAQNNGFTPDVVVEGSSTPGETSFTPADVADNKRSVTIDRDGRSRTSGRPSFDRNYGEAPRAQYSDHRAARRAAFLSGDDGPGSSLRALKRADASVGRVYAGGKNYFNDGGTLREVTSEAGRQQAATGLTAEELKDAYIKPLKEGGKEAVVPTVTKDGFESSTQVEGVYGEGISEKPTPINGIDFNQQIEFKFNNAVPKDAGDYDFQSPESQKTAREIMKSNYFNAPDDDDDE